MSASAICVVGSINLDMNAYVHRFPRGGETIHGTHFTTGYGGKGANQAVMAARLGGAVSMVGRVGADVFGEDMRANLAAEGIAVEHVGTTPGVSSGVAVITVTEAGENTIVVIPGANGVLLPDDVMAARTTVEQARVVVLQMEVAMATNLAALRLARAAGVQTIFNSAPVSTAIPDEVYGLTDIFCANETETEQLTGLPVTARGEAEAAAAVILRRGARQVVLTMGERGSLLVDAAGALHIPAQPVKAVDTTGAGDAYVGALACFLAAGRPLRTALERASVIAAVSVQAPGTQASYPRRQDLPSTVFD